MRHLAWSFSFESWEFERAGLNRSGFCFLKKDSQYNRELAKLAKLDAIVVERYAI
jgi:hypothetical protein